jgi:DNA helicase-2/ATP-dependent DNA helicase PcrA
MRLDGVTIRYSRIKHLLIDEMQDYTPVQYSVIAKLFSCNKTILGDADQAVNPYSASGSDVIRRVLTGATAVKLTRSYRSTFEIMALAQAISPNPDLVAMERHGEPPLVVGCKSQAGELERILERIDQLPESGQHSLAIICKTQRQAEKLFEAVRAAGRPVTLLGTRSTSFRRGVVICTAHLAKGLEFDEVIVPGVSSRNYFTLMDRNMLYVACTRAMHRLTLTYIGAPSSFLPR